MFGLGTTELIIILVIVMVVFGASRLPQLGKGLGSGMRNFRDALKGEGGDDEKDKLEKAPSADGPSKSDENEPKEG
jgi:sec-independent protein translocase protein TatA